MFCIEAIVINQPWEDFPFFVADAHQAKPRVAISACLKGERVRYDGRDNTLETTSTILPKHLILIPICPEVGVGMPVPRPPIQLVNIDGHIEVRGRFDKSINMTIALDQFRQQSLKNMDTTLCGYIFKSRSPSCGLNSTPIFDQQEQQIGYGSGVQAEYVVQHRPWLIMAEETELSQPQHCTNFIFNCLLLQDLQRGCQQAGLIAIDKHYQWLICQLSSQRQTLLNHYLQANAVHEYWIEWISGFEEMRSKKTGIN